MTVGFDLANFDKLIYDLEDLASKVESGKSFDKALKAGAKPIEDQMKANASSDPRIRTGNLHDAISTGPVKGSSAGKRITIGVHRKDWHGDQGDDYYPPYVEYGHGGPHPAPPHPYVRPAFDTRKEDAYDNMRDVLSNEIKI